MTNPEPQVASGDTSILASHSALEEVLAVTSSGGSQRFQNETQVAELIRAQFLPLAAQFGVPAIASWMARLPKEQVLSVFGSDSLFIPCECVLVEVVVRMAGSGNPPWTNAQDLKELLSLVRFPAMSPDELWLTSLFVRGAELPPDLALWLQQALMDASSTLQQAQAMAAGVAGTAPPATVVRARASGGAQPAHAVVFPRTATQLRTLSLMVDFPVLGDGAAGPEPASPPTLLNIGGKHRCSLHLAATRHQGGAHSPSPHLALVLEDWDDRQNKWLHTLPPAFSCHVTAWTAEGLQVIPLSGPGRELSSGELLSTGSFLAQQADRALEVEGGAQRLVLFQAAILRGSC